MWRFLLPTVLFPLTISANADLILGFQQAGSGVSVTFSGGGTVDTMGGANPGTVLNFNNFSGDPFSGLSGSNNFALTGSLTISGLDASNGGAAYTSTFNSLVLDSSGPGTSDVDLPGTFSIQNGDTYSASGTALINGLSFTDLMSGTWLSSEGDSADFGSVTLNIHQPSAVPEPSTGAALIVGSLIAVWCVRRRSVSKPARSQVTRSAATPDRISPQR